MNDKNYEENLNIEDKSCNKCKSKTELNNINKINNKSLSILPIILFILSVLPLILFLILLQEPASLGYSIIIFLFPAIALITSSIILSIKSIKNFSKAKRTGIDFKKSELVFNCINKVQLVISILTVISTIPMSLISANIPKETTKKEITKKYSDNYKIVAECRYADAGGTNEYKTVIKLNDKNIYSSFHYDINTETFFDTTDGILKGKSISLDNYLKKDYVSLVFINDINYEDDFYKKVNIFVLLNYNDYSIDELAHTIKILQDNFYLKYEDFQLNIYITDNFNKSKLDNYNLYLTAQLAGCTNYKTNYIENLRIEEVLYYPQKHYDINNIKQEIKTNNPDLY